MEENKKSRFQPLKEVIDSIENGSHFCIAFTISNEEEDVGEIFLSLQDGDEKRLLDLFTDVLVKQPDLVKLIFAAMANARDRYKSEELKQKGGLQTLDDLKTKQIDLLKKMSNNHKRIQLYKS